MSLHGVVPSGPSTPSIFRSAPRKQRRGAAAPSCERCKRCASCQAMRPHTLSSQELRVVDLLEQAASNREIGRKLNISEETVKKHLTNIFDKMGIESRVQLAVMRAKKRIPAAECDECLVCAICREMKKYRLTAQELRVVRMIVAAEGNRAIARALTISEETVKRHLSNIFDKMGCESRLQLALLAIKSGLVEA